MNGLYWHYDEKQQRGDRCKHERILVIERVLEQIDPKKDNEESDSKDVGANGNEDEVAYVQGQNK